MQRRLVSLALCGMLSISAAGNAQSFGQNKVHYDDFDFQILQTPHFDVYYYSAERDASVQAGRLAERWYARLSHLLKHTFAERQPIVLYASHAQFRETNVIPGLLPDGVGGFTEHEKGRIVLPFAAGLGETDHVIGHELVHAFQRDILREHGRSISVLPLWFLEGMAEYLSVGGVDPNTAMWLRDSVEQDRLPRIDQLDNPRWFPYRYGQSLWTYLADRFGPDVVLRALGSKASGGALGRLAAATGTDVENLSKGWHEAIRRAVPARGSNDRIVQNAAAVIGGKKGDGRLNVGPALSPDGESVVFLSERDEYSIDVFLADAKTGQVRRKILQTAADPHFDSLQFIESAGAWDSRGRRFALAALSDGFPIITVVNVETGAIEREWPLRGLDQVFGPTWSPDGRELAFSALKGGFSDLYVLDLATGAVRALTRDVFADLYPAWSPDGRRLAFATDRFSSTAETLTFGRVQLATIDLETEAIQPLPSVADAKGINPQWSPDGQSLYFIADAGATSNVYKLVLADGRLQQITNESTGVSGVTALSPALSVAAQANRIAFSVYRRGGYQIKVVEPPVGTPVAPTSTTLAPDFAASARPTARVDQVPIFGVPDEHEFSVRPYRAGLSLNRLIQPYLSAGGGATGGFVRGGVTLAFGDMLGNHQLETALQVGKSLDDFIAQAAYLNLRSRWNWGIVTGQVPWLVEGTASALVEHSGEQVLTRDAATFRQLHRELSGVAIYPFSRAKRLEVTSGVQSISFDRESTSSVYSGVTGQLLTASTTTTTAAPSATLLETSAALVYDTSIFGATSPILGERYRLSIAPTFGSIAFTTVTADYRRYFMPRRPFTIAARVMHVGRYGSGAADPRLLPLAWTLRDIVRGYGDTGTSGVGYLASPKMTTANLELRVPVKLFGRTGPIPVEILAFSDVSKFSATPWIADGARVLKSVGAGVRLNATGLVFEFDAARPFDDLAPGWRFAFNLRPGF